MVKAAAAIIIKDKKILLTKRPDFFRVFPNSWCCPGGRQEGDEDIRKTVEREVLEEVGLVFHCGELFSSGQWEDRELFRFLGEIEDGEVVMQEDEVVEWGWFSYEEAKDFTFAFEYKKVIEDLHAKGLL